VRARIRLADGREASGMSAELLAPKWFDKNPSLTNEQNFEQLRTALRLARELYLDGEQRSAFGHFVSHHHSVLERAMMGTAEPGPLPPLVAHYGPALIDRALIDALGRATGEPFHALVRHNRLGIEVGPLTPDLQGFDLAAFLPTLQTAPFIEARHTVGLVDPITDADQTQRVGDGLPETLEEVIAAYGHRWFKLKVAGQVEADVERLVRIAAVLDRLVPGYCCTLDGNEQYRNVDGVLGLWRAMTAEPRLATLSAAVAFIEQPIARSAALAENVTPLAAVRPVILDESDDSLQAFVAGRERGYTGISSKTCKGLYRALLNRARCAHWNAEQGQPRYFMSAEDLTIQAGLALQQDLALVSLLGITHVERNGHHYVNGMAALSSSEQHAFVAAHGDLYERSHGSVRLRIAGGRISLASLHAAPGLASAAWPHEASLRPMH
jgi:L-alanine-DL-glutamate epimerase-like enolase superfamily enzyme